MEKIRQALGYLFAYVLSQFSSDGVHEIFFQWPQLFYNPSCPESGLATLLNFIGGEIRVGWSDVSKAF